MMSNLTTDVWVRQESNSLRNFKGFIAERLEEGILRAITETLRDKLKADGESAKLEMPWGTYRVDIVQKGDTENITPSWEPSDKFMKLLNGDENSRDVVLQSEFDPTFLEYFDNFTKYGDTNPGTQEERDKIPAHKKGLALGPGDINYMLNGYANVLATLAKDKQSNGKIFNLEINNGFAHGIFKFEYDDNEISVKFVPDKVFKQMLKDDEAAEIARHRDFTPVKEGEMRHYFVPAHDTDPVDVTAEETEAETAVA